MAQVFYFHPLQAYQPKGFVALVPSQVRSGAASDARAWLPSDLGASCVGLFDLSSAAKVTLNSGNISAVTNDAAGTVTLTQGTGASQPPFTAGSGAFFALAGSTGLALTNLAAATEYHYFIVGTPNTSGSWRTALWAASNEHPLLIQTGTDNVGHYISGFQPFAAITATASIEALFYAHITPSAVSLGETNGATPAVTASAYGATNTNAAVLGNQTLAGGAQGFGWIRALVIVAGTLTDADRQKIEGYLAWQYSTASKLPITHPYRWQAPTIALSTAASSTGTGAATEDADTTAASGTAAIAITGASTETADTGGGNGTLNITGTGASTEGTDTTSASGAASVSASGAATEGTDTTAGAGAITARATGASTEGTDATSAPATVAVAASGAAAEGTDTSAGAGTLSVTASGASTESSYTAGGVAAVSIAASGASTEGTDTTAAAGAASVAGSGAGVEGTDTASGAGAASVVASGTATEGIDNCSGSGTVAQVGSNGTGASTEGSDSTSASGTVVVAASGSSVEANDTASGTGALSIAASGAANDNAATGDGLGAVLITGSGAANDNADAGDGAGTAGPPPRQYPLAGIAQDYPGTAATYPITAPQPYPQSSAQTYPLEGIPQQYPLAS